MNHASDPDRRAHPVDPVSLSAYRDDALEAPERRALEEHLAGCPTCRGRLATYSLLGSALRPGDDDRVPASVDRRVAALLRARTAPSRPDRRRWALRPALAVLALVALLAGALLSGLPLGVGTGGPSVAAAYPCDDPAECVVAVRFSGAVDRGDVERSLTIDPPVPVVTSWRADTLLIKPVEPLRPDTSYTLSLNPEGSGGRAVPVELRVVVGETATPIAVATVSGGAPRARTPTPPAASTAVRSAPAPSAAQPRATREPPPTPTSTASPTATPTGEATPTPCPIEPVRGFGLLYRGQPAVASRLGCPRETEQAVRVAVQRFRGGTLIWRADRKEILALLGDGTWRAYPDTFDGVETVTPGPDEPVRGFGKLWREQSSLRAALGPALGPEESGDVVVQAFDGGLLIWTDERVIRALYADGTWESYPDAYREATPTATVEPAATPTAIATPPPTGAASPAPTPARRPTVAAVPPSVANCPSQPVRGFGVVYRESPGVADRLGCARAAESPIQLAGQSFERGVMLWRADTREILVLRQAGAWSLHADTWREGEALSDAGPVPAGRFVPDRGFGKVWRQASGVRQALGWATGVEQPLPGAVQEFAGGRMLWTGDRIVYVLYPDGAWQAFVDTFVEPTTTGR